MKSIDDFVKTIAKLRSPEGCPWDKEQTHKTLKRYLIEETYEAIDAIESDDPKALMEELGDILLQVVLHAQIASENKAFSLEEITDYVNKKMISRHPHVFSNVVVKNSDEVMKNWEVIKNNEKPSRKEIFDGIPNSLPALLKAFKVSKKAAKSGFDWKKESDLWKTFEDELNEFKESVKHNNKEKQAEELGDLLFMVVNIARWYKLDPEDVLNKGIKKFIRRFSKVKQKLSDTNNNFKELTPDEINKLWVKVKEEE